MTDHVARQILDEVVSTCTGLTTTGTNVFRSRVHTMVESSLPALLIYTREDVMEEETSSMQTDGKSIFSYEMKIGQTLINGEKQGLNVQKPFFYSQTTSKHVGIVKRCADNMVNPVSIKKGYSLWYLFP